MYIPFTIASTYCLNLTYKINKSIQMRYLYMIKLLIAQITEMRNEIQMCNALFSATMLLYFKLNTVLTTLLQKLT